MKTVAQLRRVLGLGAPRNPDSLYKPVVRGPRRFNPLRIPKALQARACRAAHSLHGSLLAASKQRRPLCQPPLPAS